MKREISIIPLLGWQEIVELVRISESDECINELIDELIESINQATHLPDIM